MHIAIVGGSLAGAFLAFQLRDSEHRVSIFDHRAPWEKPCGGAFHAETFKRFPILNDLANLWHIPSRLKFIPSARDAHFVLETHSFWRIISRYNLNRSFLDAALQRATVNLNTEKVLEITHIKEGDHWQIRTHAGCQDFDVIIGADGVNSVVRKSLIGDIPREDLAMTVGFMVSDVPLDEMVFQTYTDMIGYLWYIPRSDQVSVGIGAHVSDSSVSDLWHRLDCFLKDHYPNARKLSRWGAMIPMVVNSDFWKPPCAGSNWALIGDAAGHVEALTGIGMPYALASSSLVAQAILSGDIESYDRAWREQYGASLQYSSEVVSKCITSGNTANYEQEMQMMLLVNHLIVSNEQYAALPL